MEVDGTIPPLPLLTLALQRSMSSVRPVLTQASESNSVESTLSPGMRRASLCLFFALWADAFGQLHFPILGYVFLLVALTSSSSPFSDS